MMEKLRIQQAIVVEGRYDAAKLADIVDAPILTTNGFAIFKDKEQQQLFKHLAQTQGLILLTDADAAGFKIRKFLTDLVGQQYIRQAYIPAVEGKEKRKAQPSKEGTLGVEGIPVEVIRNALLQAGANMRPNRQGRAITYTDLYEWGLSGTSDSADTRRNLLKRIGLPPRLSKKALCQVLNMMYTYEEFCAAMQEKPVLFWDFHGTLAQHDPIWYEAALEIIQRTVPHLSVDMESVRKAFHASKLPWWNPVLGNGKHYKTPQQWWAEFEQEFVWIFLQCGLNEQEAAAVAKQMRAEIIKPCRHRLKPDAISVLQQLQKRGYRQYLLSNNFPEMGRLATQLGLAPYFSGMIVSAQVGYDKPQREIFEIALQQAGMPQTAYMIGDNPMDDMQGCKQVGMIAVGVGRAAGCAQADHSVDTLTQLLELLK